MNLRSGIALCALLTLAPAAGQAADYFVESDDYKDGEEIVNVFLKEPEYRKMVEDIERNGEVFDWGWVKTADAAEAAAEPTSRRGKMMGRLRRGGSNPAEPKNLGFSLGSYKTVAIAPVTNHAGLIPPELPESVRESFVLAMKAAGLEVVPEGGAADLLLELAIVDHKADSTYIYFANLDPFIELELRLKDQKAGEDLMLLRNQAHSRTPADAGFRYADTLLKFLR